MTGFEPATLRSQSGCATKLRYIPFPSSGSAGASRWTGSGGRGLPTIPSSERVTGIEPAPSAWKAEVLPLNYTRRHTTPMGSPRCRLRVGLYRTSLPECQSRTRFSHGASAGLRTGAPGSLRSRPTATAQQPRRSVEVTPSERFTARPPSPPKARSPPAVGRTHPPPPVPTPGHNPVPQRPPHAGGASNVHSTTEPRQLAVILVTSDSPPPLDPVRCRALWPAIRTIREDAPTRG